MDAFVLDVSACMPWHSKTWAARTVYLPRARFKNTLGGNQPDPQGLKPAILLMLRGTAEAVP